MCMKTYDYKDEQKDVKGKVSFTRLGPPTTISIWGAGEQLKKDGESAPISNFSDRILIYAFSILD